jgi:alpha-beta hydrolase superfamily lysophospholipase
VLPAVTSASSPPEVAARHAEDSFDGAAGASIAFQSWLPDGDPRAVVVIAHGAGEHGGRYRYVVETLVPQGYAVYAIDHRGHGRSSGSRAQLDRLRHVVADLDTLIDRARAAHPDQKLFLLGHSMGGTISIAYALEHQHKLDGLALSAPLAALEAAPLPLRLIAQALSVVAPGAGVVDVDAEAVSRDPAEVRAYLEDPLNHHGKLPARTVQELATAIGGFEAAVPRITLPLLVLYGTADTLVPPKGGRMVHDRAGSADKSLHVYEGYFHELFNEPAGERDRPLGDLRAWLDARVELEH